MSLGKDTLLRQVNHCLLFISLCILMISARLFFTIIVYWSMVVNVANTDVSCPVPNRIDLAKPDQPNQTELGRKDDSKVHRLFLDPTGEKANCALIIKIQQLDE